MQECNGNNPDAGFSSVEVREGSQSIASTGVLTRGLEVATGEAGSINTADLYVALWHHGSQVGHDRVRHT